MTRRGRPRHPDILTPRQWEVLALLRERLSDQEIADRLGISLDGAKYHVSEILSKLGVSSREEAAAWQPEEPRPAWRRFVALPLAAKLGGASVIAAAAVGLGVLGWGVAATDSGEQDEARAIADKALAAMAAMDSYRASWSQNMYDWDDPVDFVAPDRIRWYSGGGPEGPSGLNVTIGTSQYRRICPYEQECYWLGTFAGDIVPGLRRVEWVGPPAYVLPQWPLVALEMASNLRIDDDEAESRLIRISGETNPVAAGLVNNRRVFEATGMSPLDSCEEPPCSFQEVLEWISPVLQFFEENPATIHAWIAVDDFLVHKIVIDHPPGAYGIQEPLSTTRTYSHFNEIEIEEPTESLPYE